MTPEAIDAARISFSSTAVATAVVSLFGVLFAIVGGMVTIAWRTSRFVAQTEAGRAAIMGEVREHLQRSESTTSNALLQMNNTLDGMLLRINEAYHMIERLSDRVDGHHDKIAELGSRVAVLQRGCSINHSEET